jgi:hypothetical protein
MHVPTLIVHGNPFMIGCECGWDSNERPTLEQVIEEFGDHMYDAGEAAADQERIAAESRARDLEAENARLRALLAEDVALLEELDAAWTPGTSEVCS